MVNIGFLNEMKSAVL